MSVCIQNSTKTKVEENAHRVSHSLRDHDCLVKIPQLLHDKTHLSSASMMDANPSLLLAKILSKNYFWIHF